MKLIGADSAAAWKVADLEADPGWMFTLDDAARTGLVRAIESAHVPGKPLLDYAPEAFDLGPAWATIARALTEAHHGRGFALVRGLPRDRLDETAFELLSWAIGLHAGVPRPQGRETRYLAAVRDVGTDYRSASGRGYSSSAELDFHVDGADLTTLACYNRAPTGGQSLVTSAVTARNVMVDERPDLVELLHRDFYFSRQNEQAPDEPPFYAQPIFDEVDGRLFAKWNRNRVESAQKLPGVPPLGPAEREAMDALDGILRRPELMFTMFLEPGDLQIMNNHVMLHSRTRYVDHTNPAERRMLCRLWLAPIDSIRLPDSWGAFYGSVAPASVRGGIRGHHHDEGCKAFERRLAATHGMTVPG